MSHSHHHFDRPEEWVKRFENPEREAKHRPDEVIAALKIPPDGRVAELGSGTGYFAARIARRYPEAVVYGSDVEPAMTEYLRARAERDGLANLKAIQAAADDPKLPEPVDVVLLVGVFHHLEARADYFRRLREHALRAGGRVAIVDTNAAGHQGSDPDQVIAELDDAGFELEARPNLVPQLYLLIFRSRTT